MCSPSSIDIRNFDQCIEDIERAQKLKYPTSPIPLKNFYEKIVQAAAQFPTQHIYNFVNPLINYCKNGKFDTFECASDALNCFFNHTKSSKGPTKAIQELITSVEEVMKDRLFTCHLETKKTNTLHTWSKAEAPPYHWSTDQLRNLGIKSPIIVMPSGNACGGLFNWAMCAYMVSGTPILESYPNIIKELIPAIHNNLKKAGIRQSFIDYWFEKRLNDLMTDILGVLNLGPAGLSTFIIHCRAFDKKLSTTGKKLDPTPSLFRALVGREVVKRQNFSISKHWASILKKEILFDYPHIAFKKTNSSIFSPIKLGDHYYLYYEIHKCLKIITETIIKTQLQSLKGLSLEEIRSWNEKDERVTYFLGSRLRRIMGNYLKDIIHNKSGVHLIAAATLEALKKGADIQKIFNNTSSLFEKMDVFNPKPRRNTL